MSDAFRFDAEAGSLTLQGELTIYQISEATEALRSATDSGQLRLIDLAGVSELDTAGLQWLLLAKRLPTADESVVMLVNHSDHVRGLIRLAGLSATLDIADREQVNP